MVTLKMSEDNFTREHNITSNQKGFLTFKKGNVRSIAMFCKTIHATWLHCTSKCFVETCNPAKIYILKFSNINTGKKLKYVKS